MYKPRLGPFNALAVLVLSGCVVLTNVVNVGVGFVSVCLSVCELSVLRGTEGKARAPGQ